MVKHRHTPVRRVRAAVGPVVERIEGRTLMSAGAVDPTFGTAGVLPDNVLAVDAHGRSLIGGSVLLPDPAAAVAGRSAPLTHVNEYVSAVTRLNPDGSVDTTFGTGGTATFGVAHSFYASVEQILVEPSGKILATGTGAGGDGGTLVQLTASGQVDTTFGTGGTVDTEAPAVLGPDGKITVANPNNDPTTVLRFTAAGQPDPTFGTAGRVDLTGIETAGAFELPADATASATVDSAGRTLVELAEQRKTNGTYVLVVLRLTAAGLLDGTWGTGGEAVAAIGDNYPDATVGPAVAPDGTVYAAVADTGSTGNAVTGPQSILYALADDGRAISDGPVTIPADGVMVDGLAVDAVGRPVLLLTQADPVTSESIPVIERLNPVPVGGVPTFDPTFAASGSVALAETGSETLNLFLDPAGRIVVSDGTNATRVLTAGPSSVAADADYGVAQIGTAGSYHSLGNTLAKAFDQNLSTFYDGHDAVGDWAGLDLGSAVPLVQVAFAPRAGYAARMVGGQFQVSSTADFSADVHTVYTVTAPPPAGTLTTVALGRVGAYRYVRYLGPAGGECNVAEVQVRVAGYTQIAGTAIGTAGSYKNQGNTIANAFDGSTATFVDAPTASGSYVGEDFGSATGVYQVRLAPRAGYESRMVGGQIQASDTADFAHPIDVYTIETAPPAGTLTDLSLYPEVGVHRYWRYLGPTGEEDNIAELEFDA